MELRKLTDPMPSGNNIRAAYGKVITGNIILVTVFIEFSSMFVFTDATTCLYIPYGFSMLAENIILKTYVLLQH